MKDIQLTERLEKDRNCFQIRQISTWQFFTLQVSQRMGVKKSIPA